MNPITAITSIASCFVWAVFFVVLVSDGSYSVRAFLPIQGAANDSIFRFERQHMETLVVVPRTLAATTQLRMAQVSQQDAQKAIDTVVKALRSDSAANKELGKLKKVENVLGYGSPQAGKLAVRFNASFQKGGSGFLSFGSLGGKKTQENNKFDKKKGGKNNGPTDKQRGTMVGQVKASVDQSTGKVVECSVFRDLGYGRAFNLKTR